MRPLIYAALLVLGLSASAFAQANEGVRLGNAERRGDATTDTATRIDPRAYSRSLTAKVLTINKEEKSVTVRDPKGHSYIFYIDKDTRLRADKNTVLANRKDLSLGDYEAGQMVKITFRIEDSRTLELRLKQNKPDQESN